MKKKIANALFIISLLGKALNLNAYDTGTHREIAQRAAQPSVSSVDQILKEHLGVSGGIAERFPGLSQPGLRSVEQLIGDGALFEDASLRFFNHFHNPLYQADGTGRGPWNQAGLRTFSILGAPLIRGQSSVLWQQNTSQDTTFVFTPVPSLSGGGNWSWQDGRRHYLNALTLRRKDDLRDAQGQLVEQGRDSAFALSFEALGRLTHLIQDASVPAHARNGAHPSVDLPFIGTVGNPDWYEEWKS